MAKKSMIARQRRREKLSKDITLRLACKKIIADKNSTHEERMDAMRVIRKKLPRDNSRTRCSSRCSSCHRPRGFLSRYKLCRICFRKAAEWGFIPGVSKASW